MSTRKQDQHCDAGAIKFQMFISPVDATEHKAPDAKQLNLFFLSRNLR